MIELFLALFILGVAVFVMYRLATDPAVDLNPVSVDFPVEVEGSERAAVQEISSEAAVERDDSLDSVVAVTPE